MAGLEPDFAEDFDFALVVGAASCAAATAFGEPASSACGLAGFWAFFAAGSFGEAFAFGASAFTDAACVAFVFEAVSAGAVEVDFTAVADLAAGAARLGAGETGCADLVAARGVFDCSVLARAEDCLCDAGLDEAGIFALDFWGDVFWDTFFWTGVFLVGAAVLPDAFTEVFDFTALSPATGFLAAAEEAPDALETVFGEAVAAALGLAGLPAALFNATPFEAVPATEAFADSFVGCFWFALSLPSALILFMLPSRSLSASEVSPPRHA